MTRIAANGAITKPKTACKVGNCEKEYVSKSYLKIHQRTKHNVLIDENEKDMEEVNEEGEEGDGDNSIEEGLSGGTQTILESVEIEDINDALEADMNVFDDLGDMLEGDTHLVSMVGHMVTPSLFQKEVVSSVLDVLFDSVQKKAEERQTSANDTKCDECAKYKEVESNQEDLLKKADKESKTLRDKLKSMVGQKRFHMNKGKDLAGELEESRKTIEKLQTRISILEAEKATSDGLSSIRFSSTPENEVPVPSSGEKRSTPDHGIDAPQFKCKHCKEDFENIQRLGDHIKSNHPNSQFRCEKCPKKYPFKSAMKTHMRLKHPITAYQCNVCKKIFLTSSGLDAHRSAKCKSPSPVEQPQAQVIVPPSQVTSPQVAVLQGVVQQGAQAAVQLGAQVAGQQGVQVAGQQGAQGACQKGSQGSGQQGAQGAGQQGAQVAGQQGVQGSGQQGAQGAGQQGAQVAGNQGAQVTGNQGAQVAGQQGAQVAGQQGVQAAGQQGAQVSSPQVVQQNIIQNTDIWLPRLKCKTCPYETNTQNELVYHIETTHLVPGFKCDMCSMTLINSEALVIHLVENHTGPRRERNTLDNGRWKCHFCGENISGDESRNGHTLTCEQYPYETVQHQRRRHKKSQVPCNKGEQCRFHRVGRCLFSHAQSVEPAPEIQAPERSTRRVMWCTFQDKCDRRQTCQFKHLDEDRDFLQNMLRRVGI